MEIVIRNPITWMVYAAIYVVSFAGLVALLWFDLEPRHPANLVDWLGKVSGGAIGIALFAALSWELVKPMVLFAPMLKKKIEERARKEGEERANQRWEVWLKRREEAEANGQPFDEPPPSQGS